MEWWHWVLIGIGVVGVGAIKLKILASMKKKSAKKHSFTDED